MTGMNISNTLPQVVHGLFVTKLLVNGKSGRSKHKERFAPKKAQSYSDSARRCSLNSCSDGVIVKVSKLRVGQDIDTETKRVEFRGCEFLVLLSCDIIDFLTH